MFVNNRENEWAQGFRPISGSLGGARCAQAGCGQADGCGQAAGCCPTPPPCCRPGPTGPTGPMGPMGPMGLMGPTGPTGATGPQGFAGVTGATGATGPQGPAGATGATGATGPQGPAGATGATGPQGPTGATGATGGAAPAETIAVRNTTTSEPGTYAAVVDVTGSPDHVLDFTIPRGATGPQGPAGQQGPAGATGAQGPAGPTGASGSAAGCGCAAQMRHVIEQLIRLYPTDTVVVAMESGNNASGRPGALLPAPNGNPNAGLFQLINAQGVPQEAVSICRIASIRVTGATYNASMSYLPTPSPCPSGCDADCEAAVRAYLPAGSSAVGIKAGGQTVANGTVLRNEYGVLVIVGSNQSDPTFVSTCKAEVMTK